MNQGRTKGLLSIDDLDKGEIEKILQTTRVMKEINEREIKKAPTLRGKTVINCFLEASTRTRTSFEIAGKRLSADVINISGTGSSLSKGESIKDMMETLSAMKPDILVIRSAQAGIPAKVTEWLDNCQIINGGDGRHEHPSQSLLDLFTIEEKAGKLEGVKVAIIGDIKNSRVAGSNLRAMRKMGMKTIVCGPATLLPRNIDTMADMVTSDLDKAIEEADVIMPLRIQNERINEAAFPNLREYSMLYGINAKRLERAKNCTIIMHPGPVNRGVEISAEVADGEKSLIVDQVTNGVAVRMAILYLLSGGNMA